jgi:predicted house-cleaning noncanonical NTP pyrophosphatase (MazG superfamily)
MPNNMSSNFLSIVLWNANGILQHYNEFENFLHSERIDIALLTETHLTSRSTFYISGYRTYRTDHPLDRSQGGSAVLVRSVLRHIMHPIDPPTVFLQATAVSVSTQNLEIVVSSIYCPPRFSISADNFKTFFTTLGPRFIAGGDFNSKHVQWGSRTTNPRGRALLSSTMNNNGDYAILGPGGPTYWPTAITKLPDVIDIFVTKGLNAYHNTVTNRVDLSSDHSPVLLTLGTHPLLSISKPTLTPGTTDWEQFRTTLQNELNLNLPLKSALELEDAVEHLTLNIQNAAWRSCTPKTHVNRHVPVYPQYIKQLIHEKRCARRRWQQSRSREDKSYLNRLTNKLQKETRFFKTNRFSEYLTSLDSPSKLWKATKHILKHSQPSYPLRRGNNTWAKTDQDKADLFSEHFKNIFTPHDIIDNDFEDHVEDYLSSPLQLSLPPKNITPAEVRSAIFKLPLRKTPGYDLITAEILREMPRKGIVLLTQIYNSILRIHHFPIQWKLSEVILFHKPGKPTHLTSSYRPISLLPTTSKLFERLLLTLIEPILNMNDVIPAHQFGFQQKHSAIQQLHRVVDYIAVGFEKKEYTAGVFLDISSAFDKVWHKGLLYKLKRLLPDVLYRIMQSYLEDRFFIIRQNSSRSNLQKIEAGVPQGAILSPILYNTYTSDLPTDNRTMTATYADDTVILASTPTAGETSHHIQRHLQSIGTWLKQWKLKTNTTKSQHITFSLCKGDCPPVFLNNNQIPHHSSVKYLGLHMDRRLTWSHHIKSKRLILNNRLKLLYRFMNSSSKLPLSQKLLIYKVLLQPIWTYGLQIFGCAKKSNLNKLQIFQSKLLRQVTGAPWYVSNAILHNDLRIKYVHQLAKENYEKFRQKLTGHPNTLVTSLSSIHLPGIPVRRLKRKWSRDLLT